jgi:hypothetical protein
MSTSPHGHTSGGNKLEAAIAYARHRLKVFPLFEKADGECACGKPNCPANTKGKHPRISNWQGLATTDEAVIWAWWARWPNANIGVLTGADSNLTVLDVDGDEGAATLNNFEINTDGCGELPPTPRVKTGGRGGHQHYFQHFPGLRNLVKFAPGLDIRNDGGYVVGAGSLVNSGYSFEAGCGLGEIALAEMPPWLIDRIQAANPFKHGHSNGASSNGYRNGSGSDASRAEITDALRYIDNDEHDTWLAVGLAIHHWCNGAETGFLIWCEWSSSSSKYDEFDQRKRWDSFHTEGNGGPPKTIKSLFRLALDNGWSGYQPGFGQNGYSNGGQEASEDAEHVHEDEAYAKDADDSNEERPQKAQGERPLIKIAGGDLPQMTNAAIKAISNPERFRVFKQADRLLEVAQLDRDETKSEIRRPEGAVVLRTLSTTRVVDMLTEAAVWESLDAKGKPHRKDAPKSVAETVLGRHSWPPIKELVGVVEAPTIDLASGQVLNRPGYHSSSGLFLTYAGPPVIVPANPTKDDAVEAIETLKTPFSEFPFVQDTHRSAFLAALITANLRRQLSVAPAFSFDAPARAFGTGKTMLCDAIGILTTGRICSKMAVPEDDEAELRKRLFGLLLSGDAIALLDNITGIFRSAFVSVALTAPEVKERELGFSRNPAVKTNMMLLLNGNALALAGDISTRVVPIELDANVERPAQREGFTITKLLPYLAEHRHELLGAILTLLRAYFDAGAPTQKLPVFGRFETWTAFVRQPLVWAGADDPYGAVEDVIEADPDKNDAEAILEAWFALYRDKEMVLAELLRQIAPDADEGNSHGAAALRNAISDVVFARRGEINPKAFGQWCKRSKGVIANGKRLLCRSAGGGIMQWHVEKLPSVPSRK